MRIVRDHISLEELNSMADKMFGKLVKAVVDIEQGIMAVDAQMHADEEQLLLDDGSTQENLWGINIYPNATGDEWIEFDSMINIRPAIGNRTRSVDDPVIRKKIIKIVNQLVRKC